MKYFKFLVILLLLSSKNGYAQKPAEQYTNAVLWQQYSAEYDALCFQAYHFARLSLKEALWESSHTKPHCIIVDVDETILNNSPFQGYEIQKGKVFDPKDWEKWTQLAQADTVAGALHFLKFAASKNIETFYLTNRDTIDEQATLKNLQKFDFPFADQAHILVKTNSSDKQARRNQIEEKYEVLLLCGDNLSDFSNVFYHENKNAKEQVQLLQEKFGTKFIILPNPMYGDWEKLLYPKGSFSEKEKGKLRLKKLKIF